jgi:uncharacterized membrane protein
MKKECIFLAAFLILVSFVTAAQISGEIYVLSLENVKDVVVTINTVPAQRVAAKEGSYSLDVPVGEYKLTARKEIGTTTYSAEENITIKDDGNYRFDLFLYPEIEIGDDTPEIGNEFVEEKKSNTLVLVLTVIMTIVIVFGVILLIRKGKGRKNSSAKMEENDLDTIISIIKHNGGRVTQKEIRKEIPYSEAKISLMIAELEHKGIVEKIKKGRGNIIILKQ